MFSKDSLRREEGGNVDVSPHSESLGRGLAEHLFQEAHSGPWRGLVRAHSIVDVDVKP